MMRAANHLSTPGLTISQRQEAILAAGPRSTAREARWKFWVKQGQELPMTKLMNRFVKDESGATAIEYGLIAALIAVMIIAALNQVQGALTGIFGRISTALNGAAPAT
jgi:pilus assembly protein Flp/PilA